VGDKEQPVVRHGPLFELATRQHGVVSTRQLAAIGYSRSSTSNAHGVSACVESTEAYTRLKREPKQVIERVASQLRRRRNELGPAPSVRRL